MVACFVQSGHRQSLLHWLPSGSLQVAGSTPSRDGCGEFPHDDVDGSHGVVIARDGQVDDVGITIGIDECNRGNVQGPSFPKCIHFPVGVNDDQRAGKLVHMSDAFEVAGDLPLLTHQLRSHLLGIGIDLTSFNEAFQFLESTEPLADGSEVGQACRRANARRPRAS